MLNCIHDFYTGIKQYMYWYNKAISLAHIYDIVKLHYFICRLSKEQAGWRVALVVGAMLF